VESLVARMTMPVVLLTFCFVEVTLLTVALDAS
jgi:hypothetical protein